MTDGGDLDIALAQVWRRHLPRTRDRVDVLARLAAASTVDRELREASLRAAHLLAGSLGTLGLPAGSAIAARLERALAATVAGAPPGDDIAALVAELRDIVAAHCPRTGDAA